ncbi:MAG: MaoC/PaaZ C-terminal domain-containing protein [SAR324 cluster bacterium]|nr:MaoC/PaaZ C-terminal domain-containing protein [SAR324 cluster bacterium]
MEDFYVKVGSKTTFSKTISESDVYLFAGITGDFSPNHINRQYMERSSYGRLMAHGALLVGFMSTVSTMAIAETREADEIPVSVGYDRIRFLQPVFLGDTVTVTYKIIEIEHSRKRSYADIELINQNHELIAIAKHILQWVPNTSKQLDYS